MTKTIKVALAGAGAFGVKHLDGIKNIPGVEVISLIGRELDKTKEVAAKYGIGHVTTDLAESLAIRELDAVILCTPTQMHASQAMACLRAAICQTRDLAWLRRAIEAQPEAHCTVTDVTSGIAMLGIMGPRSRELLDRLDAFMRDVVEPGELEFHAQHAAQAGNGQVPVAPCRWVWGIDL